MRKVVYICWHITSLTLVELILKYKIIKHESET